MKQFIIIVILIVLVLFFLLVRQKNVANQTEKVMLPSSESVNDKTFVPVASENGSTADSVIGFQLPLDGAKERVTKKPFGIFMTPQNSPVQPEHFTGYHTGTDFEIFPEELNIDVQVKAVCSGKLLFKKYATGYGGVAVQACELEKQSITVVYGHLKPNSIKANIGDTLNASDALGILGKAYSQETGGERKHLHLGFHKGTAIDILGYVQNQAGLSGWLDPCRFVCGGW